jgi:hypothetical protein
MAKKISLVLTYDSDTETVVIDSDASSILFPDGPCWDHELEQWAEDPELVDVVTQRLLARLRDSEQDPTSHSLRPERSDTKFIELALNIIDPDGAWDAGETLEFGHAARIYLGEYPTSSWEIEGAFNLAAQFVYDCALGHVEVIDGTSYQVTHTEPRVAPGSVPIAAKVMLALQSVSSEPANSELEHEKWQRHTSLETEDPLSGTTLRMIFGEYEGAPTLALFVGEEEEPILIDRSALQIAIDDGWGTSNDGDEPVLTFRANADHELEVIDLDIEIGLEFE